MSKQISNEKRTNQPRTLGGRFSNVNEERREIDFSKIALQGMVKVLKGLKFVNNRIVWPHITKPVSKVVVSPVPAGINGVSEKIFKKRFSPLDNILPTKKDYVKTTLATFTLATMMFTNVGAVTKNSIENKNFDIKDVHINQENVDIVKDEVKNVAKNTKDKMFKPFEPKVIYVNNVDEEATKKVDGKNIEKKQTLQENKKENRVDSQEVKEEENTKNQNEKKYTNEDVLDLAEKMAQEAFPDTKNVGKVFRAVASSESGGGNPDAKSNTDITADGQPFSVGAVQFNMTVHDIHLPNGDIIKCTKAFKGTNYNAVVINQKLYDKAVKVLSDPEVSLYNAILIAQERESWGKRGFRAWGAYASGDYLGHIPKEDRLYYVERHNRIWGTNFALDANGRVIKKLAVNK